MYRAPIRPPAKISSEIFDGGLAKNTTAKKTVFSRIGDEAARVN